MTNAELFIEKYKQLEEVVRTAYKLEDSDSISYYLTKQDEYSKYRNEIKYCQEVRNLLSHKRKINGAYPVEPAENMLKFIDRLIQSIKDRPVCHDIQIGMKDVYWQPMTGRVRKAMQIMRNHGYSSTPILSDGAVIGVFDENSIFNYLAENEIIEINDELTFADIRDYISLENRDSRTFMFFRSGEFVEKLEDEVDAAFRKGRRIEIVFITQNGKPTEKLQGIITPWDIIASSSKE